jgi:cell division septation protein DedD
MLALPFGKGNMMAQNDNSDFLPDRAAEEDLVPFDVRDSSSKAGLIKLLTGFGFLLALALLILNVYQPGVRDRQAPPKISADNTPFKVEPEDTGGTQTPNQDKVVYEVMDGKKPAETVKTTPPPEVPIKLPKKANIKVDPAPTAPPPKKPEPKFPNPSGSVKAPSPGYVKTPPPTTPRVTTGGGDYVVQVASVRSEADAKAIWNKTEAKFGDVLGPNMYSDIKYADLAEKGIYYRLRVAGLADKDAASRLCAQFKARGQACFVTRK